jgi:hypothetical protein
MTQHNAESLDTNQLERFIREVDLITSQTEENTEPNEFTDQ